MLGRSGREEVKYRNVSGQLPPGRSLEAKEAAHAYQLALAAIGPLAFGAAGAPSDRQTLASDMISRYQKLTGERPSINESRRLPDGDWTKNLTEQLLQIRTIKFGKPSNLSGSAEFAICLRREKLNP